MLLRQAGGTIVKKNGPGAIPARLSACIASQMISGTMSKATMLMILISGFTAGPAVSL